MSERSRLLQKVLETWERSDEGEEYLNWLLRPEAAQLDGGDVLREAVLNVMEEDDQLRALENKRMEENLQKFLDETQLPPSAETAIRENTAALFAEFSRRAEIIRSKAQGLARIRHALDRDRLETLEIVSQIMKAEAPDEISAFFQRFHLAEGLAAKLTSLSRTSAESIDPQEEWRRLSSDGSSFQEWLRSSDKSAEGWFDLVSERLDQYYSYQVVSRLGVIVKRGLALDPMKLEVKNQSVRSLFLEAHEIFLYGFDAASIALCRSLLEQSLRDKLALPQTQRSTLWEMIQNAARQKLIDANERDQAKKVQKAGNEIMHDISKMPDLQRTAEEVLNCTRVVLNKLYA